MAHIRLKYVCVCVCQREREGERLTNLVFLWFCLLRVSKDLGLKVQYFEGLVCFQNDYIIRDAKNY